MSLTNRLNKLKQYFSKDTEGEFDEGAELNQDNTKRNQIITALVLLLFVLIGFSYYMLALKKKPQALENVPQNIEFGTLIEDDFTSKDNQSALSSQQNQLDTMQQELQKLSRLKDQVETRLKNGLEDLKNRESKFNAKVEQEVSRQVGKILESMELPKVENPSPTAAGSTSTPNASGSGSVFGRQQLPPRPVSTANYNPNANEMSYSPSAEISFQSPAIDSFDFVWDESASEKKRRTVDNYVPTGTFVTAVVTGGADANAGVLGQGDTSPIVFQTINEGFLPNGEKSRLKNCTITGAVYGEISSSRGITRTNRMSCILPNGDILDTPVEGTAFNFGRNGIRGTAILKNGQIVQMAGVSGILTGIGETGKSLSQTTSTSALGSTATVNGSDAALNILGNATSSVGSKLADYYIKLAEQYHPIIEINPGNVVNIVFLQGFPLDPIEAEEYAKAKAVEEAAQSSTNSMLDIITGSAGMNNQASSSNPLARKVTREVFNQTPTSAFGVAQ